MTLFLASVRDAGEAETALENGADIIDVKDPGKGALGAIDLPGVRDIVAAVGARRPVSAVLGDLPMQPALVAEAAAAMAATGVTYLKVGLFPGPDRVACIEALQGLAQRKKLIGVVFADADPAIDLVPAMAAAGFHGFMIDTATKHDGRLLDHFDPTALADWVDAGRARGLTVGLAGSLEPPDIPRLLPLAPDFLGFRGALCGANGRSGRIDPAAVAAVRALIPANVREFTPGGAAPNRVDYRVLAARFLPADPKQDADATDRLFIRDLVLPVRIGAYGFERAKPQRVRFNVDCDIKRLDHVAQDMRDVVSYDLITDGIALIVAAEHIDLVETLAERVAALVLCHKRVTRVTVRVEKLDLRPGSVGVEITRERPGEADNVHPLFGAIEARGPQRLS